MEQLGHFPLGESWYNATTDKLFFTTYERDAESGNDYAMARSYINRLARFSSPDSLSGSTDDPQSLNHYSYGLNDPVNLVDPAGLAPLVYNAGYDASAWSEWLFEMFLDGSDPGGDLGITGGETWNGEEWVEQDDPGAVFGALPLGQCPMCGPLQSPAPPVDPIGSALKKLLDALKNDPNCLAFLNSKGINAIDALTVIYEAAYGQNTYGQATMLPTRGNNGNWTITNATSYGSYPSLLTVNTVGAFFNSTYTSSTTGTLNLTTDRGRISGGTVRAQEFILLHEVGHITNATNPDANNQALIDANDKDLESHCSKTINSFPKQ